MSLLESRVSGLKGPAQSAQVGTFFVDTVERRKTLGGPLGSARQIIGSLPSSMRLEIREGEAVFIEKPTGKETGMLQEVVGWSDWSGLPANRDMSRYRFFGVASTLHLGTAPSKAQHALYIGGCITIENNGTSSFQIGDRVAFEVDTKSKGPERVVAFPTKVNDQYIRRRIARLFEETTSKIEELDAVPLEEAIDSDLFNVLSDEERFKRLLLHCSIAIPLIGSMVYGLKYVGDTQDLMAVRLGMIPNPAVGADRDPELIGQILSAIFYAINPDSFSSLPPDMQTEIQNKTPAGKLICRTGSYFMMLIQTLERLIKEQTIGVVVKGSLPGGKMDVLIHPQ